jgi:exonuclease III
MDENPPFIFTFHHDDEDRETLTRSELCSYGERLDKLDWPAQWKAETSDTTNANTTNNTIPSLNPSPTILIDTNTEMIPLRVITWNCQGIQQNPDSLTTLITHCSFPDIIPLTETWTRSGTLSTIIRDICDINDYSLAFSSTSRNPKQKGRNKGGVAVLFSKEWAHHSIVRPWKGPAIHGYLDGVEIEIKDGHSLTILAAYVPPSHDDKMLASCIRKTIVHSTTQQGNRTIVGGDFNGALFGERDGPRTNGDSLHNVMLTASGLRGYSDGILRAGTCFAGNTEHGSRIDDLLTSPNIPSPHDESTISEIEFPTHSVHIPLISTLKSPTPTRRGRIEQIPPNIEQKRDIIDTDRFTTATHTALTEHLAADATLAAAIINASQQCDVGVLVISH